MNEITTHNTIRPLTAPDLPRVIDIDAAIVGRRRPVFFERRLEAALSNPDNFIYIGCESDDGNLQGFLHARLLEGEYGITDAVAVLDNIGVDPNTQGQGIGNMMMRQFDSVLEHKNINEIRSQADWRNQSIIGFFANTGFQLAARQILERDFGNTNTATDYELNSVTESEYNEYKEKDYSSPSSDEPGSLARDLVYCRSLDRGDLSALVRIDKRITNRESHAYYERKVEEVLEESGIRVSLVAEQDGDIVGFIMARVDFGEFDRIEPAAVLDNIGVDPGFRNQKIGGALLSQLFANLATLRLDIIRTEVNTENFDLLGFLMRNGFHTSQDLAFVRRLNQSLSV